MKATKIFIWSLLIICIPILILTTVLRWEINDIPFYQHGFEKYGISEITGIDENELQDIAHHLVDYFNMKKDSVQYTVVMGNKQFDLFNEREIIHLEDVRDLVQLTKIGRALGRLLIFHWVLCVRKCLVALKAF